MTAALDVLKFLVPLGVVGAGLRWGYRDIWLPTASVRAAVASALDRNAGIIWGSTNFPDDERKRAFEELSGLANELLALQVKTPLYALAWRLRLAPRPDDIWRANRNLWGLANNLNGPHPQDGTWVLETEHTVRKTLDLPRQKK